VPTIEKIATLANVSRSTVSRVINNDPDVKEETRTRVKQVIEQIDYRPNLAARRLAGGQVGVIGLLLPMPVSTLFIDPFFSLVIQGVCGTANGLDYSVMLWLAEPEYERRTIRHFLQTHMIDGVIIGSMLIDDPLLEALVESNRPFILVGRYLANDEVSYVDVDNQAAANDVVSHLFHNGYRRIGTITGPINMIAGFDRLEGFKSGMAVHSLAIEDNLVACGDFTEQGGYSAMLKLLPLHPEAVFIASDTMAIGALRAIKEAGLRVPEDIGIASFDDMPFAAQTDPPLTSVRQPIQRFGEVAVQTLIDMIGHPDAEPRHIILPTELMERGSSGSNHSLSKKGG
jgi:LacI family transcriptional regulator